MKFYSNEIIRSTWLLLLLSCSVAHAQSPGWQSVAVSSDGLQIYEAKNGSFQVAKSKGGEEIAVVIGKSENKSTSTIEVQKWYVKTADCRAKYGKLVTLDVDGSFKFENDFAEGAGNIAAAKAEFICDVYHYNMEAKRKKSL